MWPDVEVHSEKKETTGSDVFFPVKIVGWTRPRPRSDCVVL